MSKSACIPLSLMSALAIAVIGSTGCSEIAEKLPWSEKGSGTAEQEAGHDHDAGVEADDHGHDDHETEPHGEPQDDERGAEAHDDHPEHEEGSVHLDADRLASLNIANVPVRSGTVSTTVALPAEVQFDPDQVAHLVPRVAGIVREVFSGIGDVVTEGELMAVLDSRELAEAKSTYLATLAMRELAQSTYSREKVLFEKEVSPEQDYLQAKQAYEETQIRVRGAKQQLHALGLTAQYIERLPEEESASLTRYEIRAPFDATVVERHITQGETVGLDDQVYFIAQLDPVWVMGRATERDIRKLGIGQETMIELDGLPGVQFEGRIDYVGSVLDKQSRTTEVRVELANPEQKLRAGMFGRMAVFVDKHDHAETMLVPLEAVQRTDKGQVVFRLKGEGEYEAVKVSVLHESEDFAEVKGPLKEGDLVAVGDTFVLKSEAGKAEMGGGHSH